MTLAGREINDSQPLVQVLTHKRVVHQVRVLAADAVDLVSLVRAERLVRIQALDALQEPLPASTS